MRNYCESLPIGLEFDNFQYVQLYLLVPWSISVAKYWKVWEQTPNTLVLVGQSLNHTTKIGCQPGWSKKSGTALAPLLEVNSKSQLHQDESIALDMRQKMHQVLPKHLTVCHSGYQNHLKQGESTSRQVLTYILISSHVKQDMLRIENHFFP